MSAAHELATLIYFTRESWFKVIEHRTSRLPYQDQYVPEQFEHFVRIEFGMVSTFNQPQPRPTSYSMTDIHHTEDKMWGWCVDNVGHTIPDTETARYEWFKDGYGITFMFALVNDATLFKLTWG